MCFVVCMVRAGKVAFRAMVRQGGRMYLCSAQSFATPLLGRSLELHIGKLLIN